MSTYVAKAFNPVSKRIEDATYVDDYYGRHKYGIRFDDGLVHPQAHCGLDAAATALTAKDKEIEALRDSLKAWGSRYQHMSECEKLAEARAETAERRVAELEAERDTWRTQAKYETDVAQAAAEHVKEVERERDEARRCAIKAEEECDELVHARWTRLERRCRKSRRLQVGQFPERL